ncbi:MAG: hypothetical protein PHC37_04215 [Candidatus Omnitrophica bacterium]|jgi:hypothetical protein|nr:hypothetical protein [Candidatus Omnitrophota bacterium]MDD5690879.1 hypothetical protein [Candidatus Omnitrophota bacterium]
MKKIFLLFIFLSILTGVCFALTVDDNGYGWKAASKEEKAAVCSELSKTNGRDSIYWVEMLDAFYSIDNWNIMSLKIKKVAGQISLPGQPSGILDK